MNNYEYITASLPLLSKEQSISASNEAEVLLAFISGQLSERDREIFDLFIGGYETENLCLEHYENARKCRNSFVRAYTAYDLEVRNTRTYWLNKVLGRPEMQDLVILEKSEEFEPSQEVLAVLDTEDILARERGLDDLMWNRAEELSVMEVFSLNRILAFCAQLKITDRWLKLDPKMGRELFGKLVQEIRETKNK